MLTEEDYTDLEQRLFALVNDMGLNFAKYLTLITNSAELNDAEEDYHVRYTKLNQFWIILLIGEEI
jgi:hypothetical protein